MANTSLSASSYSRMLLRLPAKCLRLMLPLERYRNVRYYVVKRIPRFFRQISGRELWMTTQTTCPKTFIGSRHNGRMTYIDDLNEQSIVYSFGLGKDISFDLELIEKAGVSVYAFDPTPVSKKWISQLQLPQRLHYCNYGVADFDGTAHFEQLEDETSDYNFRALDDTEIDASETVDCPVYRIKTIMEKLGHDHIDILKMDVEGVEYGVIKDLVSSGIQVNQILVEFHHRFEGIGIESTREAIKLLNDSGYVIYDIAPDGQDHSFLRKP